MPRPDSWLVVPISFAGSGHAPHALIRQLANYLWAYMQNRLTNSQRYLVNAKPGTNNSTNPTNPNGNSKR